MRIAAPAGEFEGTGARYCGQVRSDDAVRAKGKKNSRVAATAAANGAAADDGTSVFPAARSSAFTNPEGPGAGPAMGSRGMPGPEPDSGPPGEASGRPGPRWADAGAGAQGHPPPAEELASQIPAVAARRHPDRDGTCLRWVLHLLLGAQRPDLQPGPSARPAGPGRHATGSVA